MQDVKTKMPFQNKKLFQLFFLLILLGGFFAMAEKTQATNHYVRDGGLGDGSSWSSAWDDLPSSLTRGDIYYIADGNYSGYTFDDAESGAEAITIKKAIETDHGTETGWQVSYGDGQAVFGAWTITTDYWHMAGQVRISNIDGHGFVVNAVHDKNRITGASNITLEYIYFPGGGPDGNAYANDLIYSLGGANNVQIRYCYFYNAGRTHFLTRGDDDWLVEYNVFDTNESTPEQHSESYSSLNSDNWIVRYNVFRNIEGTGVILCGYGGGWKVYGNVFDGYLDSANGIFVGWTTEYMYSGYFYNNTIVNSGDARIGWSNDTGLVVKNNLFFNNAFNALNGSSLASHNAFGGGGGSFGTDVQTDLTSLIFVDYEGGDFNLTGPTVAGDGNVGSEYNTDILGNVRGADGTWDRGAFEFVEESALQADFDSDSDVDIFDYNILLANFGTTGGCENLADADGDCSVGIFDYNILLGEFGSGT